MTEYEIRFPVDLFESIGTAWQSPCAIHGEWLCPHYLFSTPSLRCLLVVGAISWINLSVLNMFTINVTGESLDHFQRVVLITVSPVVVYTCIGVGAWVLYKWFPKYYQRWNRRLISLSLSLSFLIYPSISTEVFQSFTCQSFDDGSKVLSADFRIHCDSSRYDVMCTP